MREINIEDWFRILTPEDRKDFTGSIRYSNKKIKYFLNGLYHRIDGPALIDGDFVEYWINGEETTKEAQELYHSLMKLKGLI